MAWHCEYVADSFVPNCDECSKEGPWFPSFAEMLTGIVADGWYVSPETFRCESPQVFLCPKCRSAKDKEAS